MNTVLILLICSGKFCSNTPIYAMVMPTERECIIEAAKVNDEHQMGKSAKCVPELKYNSSTAK